MKNLFLNDEETAMTYFAVMMFKDEAKEHAPGFGACLDQISSKIEEQLKNNPVMLEGLVKLIKSEPEFANYPKAVQLIDMFEHIVSAYKIFDSIKGENEDCNLCDGVGKFVNGSGMPCPRCGGSGKLNKKETYN
jgi:hypothetical protein